MYYCPKDASPCYSSGCFFSDGMTICSKLKPNFMKEQDASHSFAEGNEDLTRLRSELQQERDRIRTLHQTLIARFYNDQLFNKDSLSKIIDEVGDLLK